MWYFHGYNMLVALHANYISFWIICNHEIETKLYNTEQLDHKILIFLGRYSQNL